MENGFAFLKDVLCGVLEQGNHSSDRRGEASDKVTEGFDSAGRDARCFSRKARALHYLFYMLHAIYGINISTSF